MATRPTIAIVGPGAVGGTVAAWLSNTRRAEVSLCVRSAVQGLTVETPTGTIRADPIQWRDVDAARPVDWALVATKAYDVAAAAAWLPPLLGPDTVVAVLQNGVDHVARFAPHAPPERILPVMVDLPAERDAPGRIRQRAQGRMLVPAGSAGAAFAALFAGTAIDAAETADFTSAVWRKLCVNSAGAVSVLTDEPGGVAWREPAAEVMRGLITECIAVGRAEGAVLDAGLIDTIIEGYRAGPRDAVNSMLADRRAGRPLEWEARNGVVGRLGRRHGIATPVSDVVTGLLAAIDAAAQS